MRAAMMAARRASANLGADHMPAAWGLVAAALLASAARGGGHRVFAQQRAILGQQPQALAV